ncbi:MAG: hypothetical protein H6619_06020 [Deltaproteobacteria bacterium]|nr:hypothetical protein [Deltaproteobacteria bacterium]
MYQFLVVASFTDHIHADAVCGVLEEMNIPVIMEHIDISDEEESATMIRLMVPSNFVHQATRILHSTDMETHGSLLVANG